MKILDIDPLDTSKATHQLLDVIEENSNRFYWVINKTTGVSSLLPSVTTIIPKPPDKVLQDWKDKLGEEHAVFINQFASFFGKKLHENMERVFSGEEYTEHLFEQYLDSFIGVANEAFICVHDSEIHYGMCGRFDALFRDKETNELVLVDFKNHGRYYSTEEIKEHGLKLPQEIQSSKKTKWREQLAMYAKGIEDTYNLVVDRAEVWCYNHGTGCVSKPVEMTRKNLDKKWEDVKNKYLLKNTPD